MPACASPSPCEGVGLCRHHDGQRLYLTRLIYSIFKEHDTVGVSCAPGGLHPGHCPTRGALPLNQGGQVDQKINEGDKAVYIVQGG